MTGRRARILVEVVDRYIHTRRPVSSQEIVRVYRHRLSPATIRNELHALEKEGFLYKPHVSAGRVPTVQGFRFFAHWLLSVAETEARAERLPAELQPAPGLPPLPELLRRTALLLAGMTGELGFVALPAQEEVECLGVVLREVRPGLILAAAVSELGVTEARLIPVPTDLSATELREAEEWLAARMGRPEEEPPSPWQGRSVHLAHQVLAELREAPPSSRVFVEGWPSSSRNSPRIRRSGPWRRSKDFCDFSRTRRNSCGFCGSLGLAKAGSWPMWAWRRFPSSGISPS